MKKIFDGLTEVQKLAAIIVAIGGAGMTLKAYYDDWQANSIAERIEQRIVDQFNPVDQETYQLNRERDSLIAEAYVDLLQRYAVRVDSGLFFIDRDLRLLRVEMDKLSTELRAKQSAIPEDSWNELRLYLERIEMRDSLREIQKLDYEEIENRTRSRFPTGGDRVP